MLWIIPAWVVSCIATFWLGFYLRGLAKKVVELSQELTMKVDRKPQPEEPKSTLLDPDDPVQEAIWQHQQMQKRLNPDE